MRLYYLNHDFQAFVQLFVVQIVNTSIRTRFWAMQSPYVLGKYPIIDHLYNDFVQEACTEIQLPGSGTIRTRKSTEMHCLPGFLLSVDFSSRWDNGHAKCTNSCDPTTGICGIRTALRPSRSQLDFRSTNFWRKKSCTTFFCRILSLVWIHS